MRMCLLNKSRRLNQGCGAPSGRGATQARLCSAWWSLEEAFEEAFAVAELRAAYRRSRRTLAPVEEELSEEEPADGGEDKLHEKEKKETHDKVPQGSLPALLTSPDDDSDIDIELKNKFEELTLEEHDLKRTYTLLSLVKKELGWPPAVAVAAG